MDSIESQTAHHINNPLALAKTPSVAGALPLPNPQLASRAENNAWTTTEHHDQAVQAYMFVPTATQSLAAALQQRIDKCAFEVITQVNSNHQAKQAYINELFNPCDDPNCPNEAMLKQALQTQQNVLIQAREQWQVAVQHYQQAVNGFIPVNQQRRQESLQPSGRNKLDFEEQPTSAKFEPHETLVVDPGYAASTALTNEISNQRRDYINHAPKENSLHGYQNFSNGLSMMQEYLQPDQNTHQQMVSTPKPMLTVLQAHSLTLQAQVDEKNQQTHTNLIRGFYTKTIHAFAEASTAQLDNIFNPQKYAATDEMVRKTLLPLGTLQKNLQQEIIYYEQCCRATRTANEQLEQAKTLEREQQQQIAEAQRQSERNQQLRYRNSTAIRTSTHSVDLLSPARSITQAMSATLQPPAGTSTYQPTALLDSPDFYKVQ